MVLTGEAHVDPDAPAVPDNPAYLAKYGERITNGWGSAEEFAEDLLGGGAVPPEAAPRLLSPRR